ncbi:NRAMP family divalent metal transporter [Demetria terragena]|uniref:NRAMP family divalent metal transporter n=1 Tax=Demetria terragena TaxID=63959 RepID=UPI0003717C5B|nr:NRAMP family divalent metal transporter [Demetria terragena]
MAERQAEASPAAGTKKALLGAMFLMATSAIGPGFITQTASFTAQLGAAFAFAIVVSILLDVAIQTNVWRVLGLSGLRAQELGERVAPGLGVVLAVCVVAGGIAFNIGNVGGAGLGLNTLTGLNVKVAALVSAAIAVAIFLVRRAGVAMDRIVVVLGALMIILTTYVAFASDPPVGDALKQAVVPDTVDFLIITTLVGGTVGGYITYAGAHRLIDSGVTGRENLQAITRGSLTGIGVTAVMRVVLFLAILGVVSAGVSLSEANPAGSAFESAAGEVGLRLFGVVLWAAGITSVIGVSYTCVSFVTSFSRGLEQRRNYLVAGFILLSIVLFLILGKAPTTVLILAGAINGLILPVGVGVILWAAWRRSHDLLGGYVYPKVLLGFGALAWVLTIWLAWKSLAGIQDLWS